MTLFLSESLNFHGKFLFTLLAGFFFFLGLLISLTEILFFFSFYSDYRRIYDINILLIKMPLPIEIPNSIFID
jgi:hypothetical protein